MKKYGNLTDRFDALGGYAAEAEAASIASNLNLPDRILDQPLKTLSGGQRRRIELARILFSDAETMILDEPTNHLDADSRRLAARVPQELQGRRDRDQPRRRARRRDRQPRVLPRREPLGHRHLQHGLEELPAPARRRRGAPQEGARQRREEGRRAAAAGGEVRREGVEGRRGPPDGRPRREDARRASTRCARSTGSPSCASRSPRPCGRTPLTASDLSKSYGSLEIFTAVDLAIDRGSKVVVSASTVRARRRCCASSPASTSPTPGSVEPGHGLRDRLLRAGARDASTSSARCSQNMVGASPNLTETEARKVLGSFLFTGDDVHKPAGVLSGGEKTRLALAMIVVSGANVLLLDEPTNNLDPASRAEILDALAHYEGAVVLVSHDEGAVEALNPERVLILPDGVEDHWSRDYQELDRAGVSARPRAPRRAAARAVGVSARRRAVASSTSASARRFARLARRARRRASLGSRSPARDPRAPGRRPSRGRRSRAARRRYHCSAYERCGPSSRSGRAAASGGSSASAPRLHEHAVRAGVARLADALGELVEVDRRELDARRTCARRCAPRRPSAGRDLDLALGRRRQPRSAGPRESCAIQPRSTMNTVPSSRRNGVITSKPELPSNGRLRTTTSSSARYSPVSATTCQRWSMSNAAGSGSASATGTASAS